MFAIACPNTSLGKSEVYSSDLLTWDIGVFGNTTSFDVGTNAWGKIFSIPDSPVDKLTLGTFIWSVFKFKPLLLFLIELIIGKASK